MNEWGCESIPGENVVCDVLIEHGMVSQELFSFHFLLQELPLKRSDSTQITRNIKVKSKISLFTE